MSVKLFVTALLVTSATLSTATNTGIFACRTETPPSIDGVLDEQVWEHATPVTDDFIQHSPDCGEPMTEATEIRILYDDDAIYFGLTMYDSCPELFLRILTPRDYDVSTEWIGIWLDTFNDDNNCYAFFVSIENVQQDGRFSEVGGWDISWDAVWESGTSTSETGWSAEFAIPFTAIRYPSTDQQLWGVNFKRRITRTNESAYLFRMADNGNLRIEDFGDLQGLRNLPASRQFELLPYGASKLIHAPGSEEEWDPWANAGLDAKIGISSSAVIDLTVNPDFGQIEADPDEVNLSHWESFLREKRPFFLEGSDLFQMPFSLFYSRRIGAVASNGEIIPIIGGAKLTGTAGGFRFGLMDAYTGRVSEDGELYSPATNYSAFRIVREFGEGSYMGASLTSTDVPSQTDTDYSYGRSGAVDWQIRFLSNHTLNAASAGTWNSVDSVWKNNMAYKASYSYGGDRFDCRAGFYYKEEDFNANMIGYTSCTGDVNTWAGAGLFHPFESNTLQHGWLEFRGYYNRVPGGVVTGRGFNIDAGVVFRNRYHIDFDLGYSGSWTDRYEGPDGTEYDGGLNWGGSCSLDSRRKLYAMFWAGGGSWYEGSSTRFGSWLSFKPASYISFDADISWRATENGRKYNWDIEAWDRQDTDWRTIQLGGTWMFSNDLSLRLTSQISRFQSTWDQTGRDSSNAHWMNVLLGWHFRPGSMLYIMAGENADPDEDGWYSDPEFTVYGKMTWFLPL